MVSLMVEVGESLVIDFALRGSRVVVAGAGEGMGRATALTLAAAGARVMCADITRERVEKVVAEIAATGGVAHAFDGDLCDRATVEALVASAVSTLGGIDVSVDVIGQQTLAPLLEVSDEVWERNARMNLRHAVLLGQVAGRQMVDQGEGGSLVFVASVSGITGHPGNVAYSAAKAGLMAMIRSSGVELAPLGVRVNGVAPGWIDTPRIRATMGDDVLARRGSVVPMGRLGSVQDIADAATFLASPRSKYITGQTLVVDGGAMGQFPLRTD
jgi:NAD(P)-dependent dehydrogenase (short-subunit alcohol dehydrogenase family)